MVYSSYQIWFLSPLKFFFQLFVFPYSLLVEVYYAFFHCSFQGTSLIVFAFPCWGNAVVVAGLNCCTIQLSYIFLIIWERSVITIRDLDYFYYHLFVQVPIAYCNGKLWHKQKKLIQGTSGWRWGWQQQTKHRAEYSKQTFPWAVFTALLARTVLSLFKKYLPSHLLCGWVGSSQSPLRTFNFTTSKEIRIRPSTSGGFW